MATTMTLRSRLPRPPPSPEYHSPVRKIPKRSAKSHPTAPTRRSQRLKYHEIDFESSSDEEEEEDEVPEYERLREQRMRENKEKMEKLGIFGLSQQFKQDRPIRRAPPQKKPSVSAPYQRARKSDRLKVVGRVSYFRDEGTLESMGISVPETWASEVYTEEHEKLLVVCEKPWTLYVDGYGEDGERLYDPLNGKMCHQCRQKTVGSFSICRNCKSPQGQICGDCLYMRYGENVMEANENANWSCPACRDICNCSRCRRVKGWAPTTCLYPKVIEQGYKSIAHYLIKSRRGNSKPEDIAAEGNVDPNTAANSWVQMIGSDSSDGSSDDDSDGYNSDSSEEAKKSQQPSAKVPDDTEVITLGASEEENEMSMAEMKRRLKLSKRHSLSSAKFLDDTEVLTVGESEEDNEISMAEMKRRSKLSKLHSRSSAEVLDDTEVLTVGASEEENEISMAEMKRRIKLYSGSSAKVLDDTEVLTVGASEEENEISIAEDEEEIKTLEITFTMNEMLVADTNGSVADFPC